MGIDSATSSFSIRTRGGFCQSDIEDSDLRPAQIRPRLATHSQKHSISIDIVSLLAVRLDWLEFQRSLVNAADVVEEESTDRLRLMADCNKLMKILCTSSTFLPSSGCRDPAPRPGGEARSSCARVSSPGRKQPVVGTLVIVSLASPSSGPSLFSHDDALPTSNHRAI